MQTPYPKHQKGVLLNWVDLDCQVITLDSPSVVFCVLFSTGHQINTAFLVQNIMLVDIRSDRGVFGCGKTLNIHSRGKYLLTTLMSRTRDARNEGVKA